MPRPRKTRSRTEVARNGRVKTSSNVESRASSKTGIVPCWVAAEGNLYWRGRVVFHLAAHAYIERAILDAFERENWRSPIADPLPREPLGDPTQARRSALKNLHRHQGNDPEICFYSLQSRHVGWRLRDT